MYAALRARWCARCRGRGVQPFLRAPALSEERDALGSVERACVLDEFADVQIYLLELADRSGVGMVATVRAKMVKNAVEYSAG
jgi:hypothetical protein